MSEWFLYGLKLAMNFGCLPFMIKMAAGNNVYLIDIDSTSSALG